MIIKSYTYLHTYWFSEEQLKSLFMLEWEHSNQKIWNHEWQRSPRHRKVYQKQYKMCQECPEPSSQGASYVLSCSKHNSSIFWSWISSFFLTLSLNKTLFLMFFTLRNGHFLSLSNTRLFYETRFVYARTFRNPISTLSFKIWNFITRFELVSFKIGITLLVQIPFCLKKSLPEHP